MLFDAIRFATDCHASQKRKYTGAPYIQHPLRVMCRAMQLPGVTEEIACAAVLHDVVEDCAVERPTLEKRFGPEVASLVAELTNVSKQTHPAANRDTRKKLDWQRLSRASVTARRLKLLDRMDNLRDIPLNEGFLRVYVEESRGLLSVLRGADADLEKELESLIETLSKETK